MKKITPLFVFVLIYLCVFNVLTYSQQSCTGIIHVTKTGSDIAGCGTEGSPCLTINYGLSRALEDGLKHVRAGNGSYEEVVVLKNGISLWGGFDSNWDRTSHSEITGGLFQPDNEYIGVKAENITAQTVISDFDIRSPDAAIKGKSSYVIHLSNSQGLQIQNCNLYQGHGAEGLNGTDGTDASQTPAQKGGDGVSGEDVSLCDTERRSGGSAGTNPAVGSVASGGTGGAGGSADTDCDFLEWDYNARPGYNGSNATIYTFNGYGYGGNGGNTCHSGYSGYNGRTVNGSSGGGASTSGSLSGSYWQVTTAQPGSLGQHGTGGGGGGGAGGCDEGTDNTGSGGGGGGAGGARSTVAGTGGQSGGTSFGIFMLNSIVKIKSCFIDGGDGGYGGKGGEAGLGQPGGQGGAGGYHYYGGGDGGYGGKGGASGAGGGGAGGSSYIFYGASQSYIYYQNLTYELGVPGSGGNGGYGQGIITNGGTGAAGSNSLTGGAYIESSTTVLPILDPCCLIFVTAVSSNSLCKGGSLDVYYSTKGSFAADNVFTAELSDKTGNFSDPVIIGTLASTVSSEIFSVIPEETEEGNNYRIRIKSTNPATISYDNTQIITVNPDPEVTITASDVTVCRGNEITLAGNGASFYSWDNGVIDGVAFTPPEGTTTYIVEGTDDFGCTDSSTIEITVNPAPLINAISTETDICFGEKITLTGSGGVSYAWDHGVTDGVEFTPPSGNTTFTVTGTDADNCSSSDAIEIMAFLPDTSVTVNLPVLISNATSATFQWYDCDAETPISGAASKSYLVTENGSYAVIVTQSGCTYTSPCYNIIVTNLYDESENSFVRIYPNPTDGLTWIDFSNVSLPEITLKILNLEGRVLYTEEFNSGDKEMVRKFDFSTYGKGLYIIILSYEGKTTYRKLVVD